MKINLAHVSVGRKVYGAEYQLTSVIKYLNKENFNCLLILIETGDGSISEFAALAQSLGIKTTIIKTKYKLDVISILMLRKVFSKYNVDIVHAHGYKTIIMSFFATRFTKIKLVATLHGWGEYSLKLKLYNNLAKFCLVSYNKIITVSEKLSKETKKLVNPKNVVEIRNAIDLERFSGIKPVNIFDEFNIGKDKKIILYTGRLSKEKGVSCLIKIMKIIKKERNDIVLLIIGDGEMTSVLKSALYKMDLKDKIILDNWRIDVLGIVESCSLFILPSLSEGIPRSLMEAMGLGKPIIATNVGGIGELVKDGIDGILVESGNIDSIKKAIYKVLDDADFARKLGENASKKIRKLFDVRDRIPEYEAIYTGLISG